MQGWNMMLLRTLDYADVPFEVFEAYKDCLSELWHRMLLKVGEKSILDWLVNDLVDTTDIDEFVVILNHKFAQHFENWENNRQKTRSYAITVIDDETSTNETCLGAVKDIQLAVEN